MWVVDDKGPAEAFSQITSPVLFEYTLHTEDHRSIVLSRASDTSKSPTGLEH